MNPVRIFFVVENVSACHITLSIDLFTDNYIERMSTPEVVARVKHLTDPSLYHIDLREKDKTIPQESFRKLTID